MDIVLKTMGLLLLAGACRLALAQEPPAMPQPPLPGDVAAFLEERESCDHWRGEEGYDPERRAEISWSVCQYCTGTDTRLARLKQKYRGRKAVMARLEELESRVEMRDTARRQCRVGRKSRWIS